MPDLIRYRDLFLVYFKHATALQGVLAPHGGIRLPGLDPGSILLFVSFNAAKSKWVPDQVRDDGFFINRFFLLTGLL